MGQLHAGEVTRFDAEAGWGTVRWGSEADLPFHCTALADGSRSVEVAARVVFTVVAGHHGRWEASGLVVVPNT